MRVRVCRAALKWILLILVSCFWQSGEGVAMVVQLATETHHIGPISAQDVILALV